MRTTGFVCLLAAAAALRCAPASGVDEPTGSAGVNGGTSGTTGQAGTAAGTAGTGGCATAPGLRLGWSLGRDVSGMGLTCAQAGATTVDIFMDSDRYEFPCANSPALITPLAPKAYNVRVLVLGAQNIVISPVATGTVTIGACGVVELPVVKFTVTPTSTGGAGNSGAAGSSGTAGTGGGAGTSGGAAGAAGPCNAPALFASHSCTIAMACHDAKGSAAGFDMVTAGWEKAMVGKLPSKTGGISGLGSQCTNVGMPYLMKGSAPAKGLFLSKLSADAQLCGGRMPLVPPFFTPAELTCIQTWANALVK